MQVQGIKPIASTGAAPSRCVGCACGLLAVQECIQHKPHITMHESVSIYYPYIVGKMLLLKIWGKMY